MVQYRAVSKYTCMMLYYLRYDAMHQQNSNTNDILVEVMLKKLSYLRVCIGQITGGTHDSRSLYILLVSDKMDRLSKIKAGGFLTNEIEVALLLFYPMGLKLTSSLQSTITI
jgi:hypothetical protein